MKFVACYFLTLLVPLAFGCQSPIDKNRTWSVYKADAFSSSYSPLDHINTNNVQQLKLAWTFIPGDGRRGSGIRSSECNPIVVDGILYMTSARHRLYAIQASSGKEIWSHDPFDGGIGGGVSRGVAYWESGNDKRILYTAGDHLFAINALTGKPIVTFGDTGKVSMNEGMRGDPKTISVVPTSPGIIYKDLIIMGAEVSELFGAQPGYVRAYSVRTGKLIWTFHTIPQPGEAGYETWPKDAWKYAGGVNDWAGLSLDEKRGMVFLALGSPSYDFYGSDRIGANLYGNSVVALDANTGKYIWHYQTIHHDLWDYDLPAPPNLLTIERDGKKIEAVAQTTKTGFLFLFDRITGKPLFPIEERKVPPSLVPGEQAWATQPFPLLPKPYARQSMSQDDLSHFSDAAHDSLVKRFSGLRNEGLFTPPDTRGTLMMPGTRGGSEWGGGAVDPASGIIYIMSSDSPEIDLLQKIEPEKFNATLSPYERGKITYLKTCATCHGKDRKGDEPQVPGLLRLHDRMKKSESLQRIRQGKGRMPAFQTLLAGKEDALLAYLYEDQKKSTSAESQKEIDILEIHGNSASVVDGGEARPKGDLYLNVIPFSHFLDKDGNPSIKPPWGKLSAVNLNTGEYVWQVVIGDRPGLRKKDEPITGAEGYAGPIVTAGGLVFISSTMDKKLRAFDKTSGNLLWETNLPGVGNATPSTYWADGKQYLALSVAGDETNPQGFVMAFALP